jgi:glycosyltransferase involved in cell wall biosynthesis
MIESIRKVKNTTSSTLKYSILIPTWNNLEYLKLCIASIKKNSHFDHQIIVLINEGTDGTADWAATQHDIDYIVSKQNIGICYGLNLCRSLVKTDYIVYANDDMYLLPNWDLELHKEIEQIGHKKFMLSSTMIEPFDTGNPCVVVKNYGDSIETFNEKQLLKEYNTLHKDDWFGSTWPPNILHIDLWDLVGGMSIEFSPGLYSDPDLSMKLWQAGIRLFKGVGASKVYHFGSKSTKRRKLNAGKKVFIGKWGMTSRFFTTRYLHRGEKFNDVALSQPTISPSERIINKLKQLASLW